MSHEEGQKGQSAKESFFHIMKEVNFEGWHLCNKKQKA
jgi:hypothetical protein